VINPGSTVDLCSAEVKGFGPARTLVRASCTTSPSTAHPRARSIKQKRATASSLISSFSGNREKPSAAE
jgi:hypothetical protein